MREIQGKEMPMDESDSSKRMIGKKREADTQLRWAVIMFILSVLSFLSGPLLFFLMSLGVFGYGSGNSGIAIGLVFLLSFFVFTPCLAIVTFYILFYRCQMFSPSSDPQGYEILTFAILGLNLFLWFAFVVDGGESHRWSCSSALRQCEFACKFFLKDSSKGYYPELSPQPGRLMFSRGKNRGLEPFFSTYLSDPATLICPKDVLFYEELQLRGRGWDSEALDQILNDRCYMYLGYAVRNDLEVTAFAKAYRERIAVGKRFNEHLKVAPGEGNCASDTIYQLQLGIEKVLSDVSNHEPGELVKVSEIPLMIERVPNYHTPRGGHVLYMDGHVDYLSYPGKWPMTETTMTTLQALADIDQPRREYTLYEKLLLNSRRLAHWGWALVSGEMS